MSNQILGTYYTVFTANNNLYYDLDANGIIQIPISGTVSDIFNARGGSNNGVISNRVFEENDLVVNTSYTITQGRSAMSVGPITVAPGVTVNVPTGSKWMIL